MESKFKETRNNINTLMSGLEELGEQIDQIETIYFVKEATTEIKANQDKELLRTFKEWLVTQPTTTIAQTSFFGRPEMGVYKIETTKLIGKINSLLDENSTASYKENSSE